MGIRVRQLDITDCGAACLASIAKFYKLDLPIARVRQKAGTDKKGTSMLGLVQAAESFGFDAKGVKGPYESLKSVPLPAIAHIVVKGYVHHYVVINRITGKGVEIMDPADGEYHFKTREEFSQLWSGVLVLLLPSDDFESSPPGERGYNRFWFLLRPHRSILIQSLFGALIYTVLGLSMSVYIQKIVDNVIIGTNFRLLNLMTIAMVLLLLLRISISSFKNVFVLRTGQLIDTRLILGYYKHLLSLPQQFFDSMRVGEITSRINDAVKIRLFINDIAINLVVNICMLLCSLALMFTYYWKLGLIMASMVPIYFLIYFAANKLNKKWQRKLMEESSALESQLVESLNSIGTIKRLGLEAYSNNKTEIRFIKLLGAVYRSGMNSVMSGISTEFVSQLFTIILLWLGAGFVLNQQISPGELLSFYALIAYFTAPVSSIVGMNRVVQDAFIAADRLFELMDLEKETPAGENQIELNAGNIGDIRFSDISFRYGARVAVFENLNLIIPLKKMTAIVGESGCGKSTLAALLHNIYPVTSGNIFIGNHALKYFTTRSLRAAIGVVPQVTDLFYGSVISNITIGDENVDMESVLSICDQLGITKFIEDLPEGFETNIGENGFALSGGQRQRIAIARALYRDPEILILDEATSSLDLRCECFVRKAIEIFLGKGRTVIVIAHRLSTIQNADKIIVMKDGKVVEEGSHEFLMSLKSDYHLLWSQNASFNNLN